MTRSAPEVPDAARSGSARKSPMRALTVLPGAPTGTPGAVAGLTVLATERA